jgi:hypothetical protein
MFYLVRRNPTDIREFSGIVHFEAKGYLATLKNNQNIRTCKQLFPILQPLSLRSELFFFVDVYISTGTVRLNFIIVRPITSFMAIETSMIFWLYVLQIF